MESKNKNGRRAANALSGTGMICRDTAVLHGERGATVYGCRRILRYAPSRICLCVGKRHLFVRGADLLCTAFNAGCVSIDGRVDGIGYCRELCGGECDAVREEDATV